MERRICPILEYCKSSSQTPQGNSADNENMSMAKLLCLQLHIFLIFLSLRPNIISWYGGVVFYCGPALCCVLLRVGVVLCFTAGRCCVVFCHVMLRQGVVWAGGKKWRRLFQKLVQRNQSVYGLVCKLLDQIVAPSRLSNRTQTMQQQINNCPSQPFCWIIIRAHHSDLIHK